MLFHLAEFFIFIKFRCHFFLQMCDIAEDVILGVRYGIVIFLCAIVILAIIMMIFGYFKFVCTGMLEWSEVVLGAFSNLISPCVVQHQTSGMVGYFSSFLVLKLAILLSIFTATISENTMKWNSSIDNQGMKFLSRILQGTILQPHGHEDSDPPLLSM